MPVSPSKQIEVYEIAPRSGVAFRLRAGQRLTVRDIRGEQVSDLIAYAEEDTAEVLSAGRTFDYNETLFLTAGHPLYSNRSRVLLTIEADTVGRHDFLLTPCSADTFRIIYGHRQPHHGCHGNLARALVDYGISPDAIPTTFNIFMNTQVDGETGKIKVCPPKSRAGDFVTFRAERNLIVGLTACSAEQSNNGSFKPIGYELH